MSDEGGAGRRRGLFRRNRSAEDQPDDRFDVDFADLPPADPEEVAIWEQTSAPRTRAPKRTADMFAPKESFSDTWSEDAWDDEWKEPAVRRTSIPPAADPTPQKVDEWLESGAGGFDDMTRDNARKLGVDPALAAARAVRPGATWDDTGDVSTNETRSESTGAPELSDPMLQATIERALSAMPAPPAAPPDATRIAGVSKRFGRSRSTVSTVLADATADAGSGLESAADIDDLVGAATPSGAAAAVGKPRAVGDIEDIDIIDVTDRVESKIESESKHGETAAEADVETDETAAETAAEIDDEIDDEIEAPERAWDRPVFAPTGPKADDEISGTSENADEVAAEKSDDESSGEESADDQPARRRATAQQEDESADEEIEMDRTRATAFTDRASWIGTGLAGVAVLRLAFHIASNMKQADPAEETLGGLARIGGGFANAGLMHGLLLIAAVTLLSLPALFDRDDLVPRRTSSGLGLVLGAALVGLIGAIVALITQSTLADAIGTKVTLGSTGEMLAALALSVVALGATMRALRSYTE